MISAALHAIFLAAARKKLELCYLRVIYQNSESDLAHNTTSFNQVSS